ncbi:MAG TPA: M2 family metallopeptidase [Candidatus Eisenbacteria bacterium]
MNSSGAVTGSRERDLSAFVERFVAELKPLELQHNQAFWLANTTGEARYEEESARLESAMRMLFARPEPYRMLSELRSAGTLADPLLDRQLTLLHHAHRARQLPPEMIERQVRLEKGLESRFNQFRAQLDGRSVTDNELVEMLRSSNDLALRRRAWEASKQIGAEVEADLLALVRLRNEGARQLGFSNYYSMALELDELDERELFALFDDLERDTNELWSEYKGALDRRLAERFGVAASALRPWHYADPFFQEAPPAEVSLDPFYASLDLVELTRRYFAAVGFSIDDVLERSDLFERAGKCQHAFCVSVDRGADVRVLCNVRPTERWMGTLLHEFGHAVYDRHLDPALPWLLRTHAHILATEASAMLFGRLSRNPVWLREWAGVGAAEIAKHAEPVARAVRDQLLVQTRWEMVMVHMERALYRDPGQNVRSLWWELVERYQGVPRPEARDAPDWAAKIHLSIAPVYYHNYQLGEMLASQLQDHLLRNVLGGGHDAWERYVRSPKVAEVLIREFYAHGKRWSWRELTQRVTGRPLASRPFVDELAGRTPA